MGKKEDDETEVKVAEYLIQQNRPYNLGDIFQNLRQEYGKTAIQKALTKLASEGKIVEKENGKQKIYYQKQEAGQAANKDELAEMDNKLAETTEKVKELSKECDAHTATLRGLGSSLTREEILMQLSDLRKKNAAMKSKLETLRTSEVQVTPGEKEKVDKDLTKYLGEWRKRKRIAKDILDSILEGYGKKPKVLYEEMGIETDEDCGVDPTKILS